MQDYDGAEDGVGVGRSVDERNADGGEVEHGDDLFGAPVLDVVAGIPRDTRGREPEEMKSWHKQNGKEILEELFMSDTIEQNLPHWY